MTTEATKTHSQTTDTKAFSVFLDMDDISRAIEEYVARAGFSCEPGSVVLQLDRGLYNENLDEVKGATVKIRRPDVPLGDRKESQWQHRTG